MTWCGGGQSARRWAVAPGVVLSTVSSSRRSAGWFLASLGTGVIASIPRSGLACAACYGASDSPMAAGMNWGIVALLGMIVAVLGGIAACFVVLARRSATMSKEGRQAVEAALLAQAQASWPAVADTKTIEAPILPDRGGLMRVSTLAQKRRHCAPAHSHPTRPPASRGRS